MQGRPRRNRPLLLTSRLLSVRVNHKLNVSMDAAVGMFLRREGNSAGEFTWGPAWVPEANPAAHGRLNHWPCGPKTSLAPGRFLREPHRL